MKLLLFAIVFVLSRALAAGALLWDRRRLALDQRARSWNLPTWVFGIFWFSAFAAIPWAWVTRGEWAVWRKRGLAHALGRSVWLLLEGAAAAAVILAAWLGAAAALAAAFGIDLDDPSSGN
jgi:hypothetical protein